MPGSLPPEVRTLGPVLASLASTLDDRYLLDAFADLLEVGPDVLGPLLLTAVVEPFGGAQFLTVGHACPGLTWRANEDMELRLVFAEELVFLDGDPRTGPPREPRPDPLPVALPEPIPPNIENLGATLAGMARAAEDRRALERVAAALGAAGAGVDAPLMFTVLVQPVLGAKVCVFPGVRSGTTLHLDADLRVRLRVPGSADADDPVD